MKKRILRILALTMAVSLLLTSCGITQPGGASATTMHLKRTEGRVGVSDGAGKDVEPRDDLGLYSGYGVDTRSESYAWIDLDEVKLTKLDEKSEIAITKEDKKLEIEVLSGSLFFNVTQPLAEDETMTIRSSTMAVGIRGTCGWVSLSEDGDALSVYLLEGRVRCEADGERETVRAGEMAVMTEDGEITVEKFSAADIPTFVVEEIEEDDDLAQAILDDSGIDVLNPEDPALTAALEQYRAIVGRAETYFEDYTDYVDDVGYSYALVQMQTEYQVPALVLEMNMSNDMWGDMGYAIIFQFNPESQTVIQVEGELTEGVAAVGGFRGTLEMAGDGIGIISDSFYSGTGEGSTERVTLAGASLRYDTIWSGNVYEYSDVFIGDSREIGVQFQAIPWHEISDLSGLDSWTPPEPSPVPLPEPENPAGPDELPTDGNRTVLLGTVGRYTYNEVLALQGIADPNAGYSDPNQVFYLIVLDTPQPLTARSGDGQSSYEREASLIDVTQAAGIERYDGQHVVFSIDSNTTWWQSDVSLPDGEPRTNDVHILG